MKKNYIYLFVLVLATVLVTLGLSKLYQTEVTKTSYAYEKMNKITSTEYDEYIVENSDTIIYIADKNNLSYNKFEKKFIKKIDSLNLLKNVIYIEKEELNNSLNKKLKKNYSYEYDENLLPAIIVINDGVLSQVSYVNEDSQVEDIINYEVFE